MGVLDPQSLIFALPPAGSLYLFFAIHYGAKQNSWFLFFVFLFFCLRPRVHD